MPSTGLEGKVAVVTGAARAGGIGRAICRSLGQEGAKVVVSDIGRQLEAFPDYEVALVSELDEAVAELRALGAAAIGQPCDVSREEEVHALVARAVEEFGRVDVFVNNAGLGLGLVPVVDITAQSWDQNLDVMAKGTFLGVRAAARQMIVQGDGGRIVNISSQAGKIGIPLLGAYCAAKFAVIGLTQTAARELGPHNITVNAVCPGTVATPLLDLRGGLWEVYAASAGVDREELKRRTLEEIPLGRFQRPEDVADVVVFLASAQGSFITGASLNATGGQTMF